MRLLLFLCALIASAIAVAIDNESSPLGVVLNNVEEFSTNLYKTVSKIEKENLVTSSLMVNIVLSMAAYGARGNTEKEMRNVLKLPADDAVAKSGFQNLIDKLNNVKHVELKVANKIFIKDSFTVKPEYNTLLMDIFRSTDEQVDFTKAFEAADVMNSWCKRQTNNKINNVFTPDNLDPFTKMVLVNAIYFKGKWHLTFNANLTTVRPFHIDDKTVKNVPTMYQQIRTAYGVLPELKAKFVEIPYEGKEVSMIIILPDEINGLQELETKMETMSLSSIRQKGFSADVELFLPKFKIENKIKLNEILKQMGMEEMFTENANFNGISVKPLQISEVIQKAFIEVNEEGAKAAAITKSTIRGKSFLPIPNVTFEVNKPFLFFLIYKAQTSYTNSGPTITLFNGRVKDPAKK